MCVGGGWRGKGEEGGDGETGGKGGGGEGRGRFILSIQGHTRVTLHVHHSVVPARPVGRGGERTELDRVAEYRNAARLEGTSG